MRKNLFIVFAALLVASMVLSACGPAATPTPETVTVVETQLVPVEITSTPGPAAPEEPTAMAPGSVQITGSGATFPLPLYTDWTYAYQYVDPAVAINYQGIGSGGGKKAIVDGTVDFAGSDSLLSDDDYKNGKDLQMYPMVASAVVVIYNVAFKPVPTPAAGATAITLPKLILDRQTLVDIYDAKIKKWSDPAIVALNPDLKDYLPDLPITVAHRSDSSGTTEIFTKALKSFSPDWTAAGSAIEWSVDKAGNGVGGKGNQGVAAAVINTPNSIGYTEISFATSNGLAFADLINKAGKKVTANAASIAADMTDYADAFDAKLNATIVDGKGDGSWPITGYTYLILHTTSMTDCVKAAKLLEYIHWSLTDKTAADRAGKLGYAVLPDAILAKVTAKLGEVTCNGAPVMKP